MSTAAIQLTASIVACIEFLIASFPSFPSCPSRPFRFASDVGRGQVRGSVTHRRPDRRPARIHRYNARMDGRECYHCKQWIEEGEGHDCWTTTESCSHKGAVRGQDAWKRLRETAVSFG